MKRRDHEKECTKLYRCGRRAKWPQETVSGKEETAGMEKKTITLGCPDGQDKSPEHLALKPEGLNIMSSYN